MHRLALDWCFYWVAMQMRNSNHSGNWSWRVIATHQFYAYRLSFVKIFQLPGCEKSAVCKNGLSYFVSSSKWKHDYIIRNLHFLFGTIMLMIASQPFSYIFFLFSILRVLSVFVVKFRGCFSATFRNLITFHPLYSHELVNNPVSSRHAVGTVFSTRLVLTQRSGSQLLNSDSEKLIDRREN